MVRAFITFSFVCLLLAPSYALSQDGEAVLDSAKAFLESLEDDAPPAPPPAGMPSNNDLPAPEEVKSEAVSPAPVIQKKPKPLVKDVSFVLDFDKGAQELKSQHEKALLDNAVRRMKDDQGLRLEIMAHATSDALQDSTARRISLERGLNIRRFMEAQNIEKNRIDIKPMGQTQQKTDSVLIRVYNPMQ